MNKVFGSLVLVPLVLGVSTTALMAQQRPEGIRAGGFYLQPSLELGVRYDDNIFNEQGNQSDSDVIGKVKPNLIVRTARRVHLLELNVGADADFHVDNNQDDSVDAHAILRGRYDVSRRTKLRAEGSIRRAHDNRGSDVAAVQAEPTFRHVYTGKLAAETKPNRMSFAVNGDVSLEDYEDSDAINNDDDRDVVIYGVGARIGYEARKGYTVFIAGRYDVRDFNDAVDDVGIRRGSDGYRVRAGFAFNPTSRISASASVGYLSRSFDERTFNDVDGVDANADVRWELPGNKTVLGLTVRRAVAEATDNDVAGRLTTSVNATIDQKIGRRMTVKGKLGYVNADEEGGAGNRDDDTYSVGIGADYAFHKNVKAGAFYDYERRVSNEVDTGHVKNVVGVRLRIGF